AFAKRVVRDRLADHREFVAAAREDGREFDYRAEHYDVPVTTSQEREIQFFEIGDIEEIPSGYRLDHVPAGAAGN
ncbi:MAG: site-specific DNA-methyltransferase, partial [Halodesulfurarchaeum sp.]